ncbi:MAG: hypothetical protein ACK53K_07975 [Burkholderiales bacterium]
MWLLILEALGALMLFVFIVWWTMFSGRQHGERHVDMSGPKDAEQSAAAADLPPTTRQSDRLPSRD